MKKTDVVERAKEVLDIEAKAVRRLKERLGKEFAGAVDLLAKCKGRIVVSGMGKTGIIAQKFSATLSSTGSPSLFLHLAEAAHGDLGKVTSDDVVVILSNSGESAEVRQLLLVLKKIGTRIVAVTGNVSSSLAKYSDAVLDVSVEKEACPFGLAPTASTTACLAMTDAIAICLLERKDFKERDFALFHPGGSLGRRLLLTVDDIMRTGAANPVVRQTMKVSEVLLTITRCRAGAASVVDAKGRLVGIFTDGDLRRHLDSDPALPGRRIAAVMTRGPLTVKKGMLAAEALRVLEQKKIDEVPVLDEKGRPVGMLDVQDLLKAGVV
ncbi:KpsF/GutQ family sugar-phosphate isomerase [Candidatus Sumerlaeota bacterium]|nr:KpsF/GutQ family sugar-phosphate isomerase [Candidatus Sumerlaeota bacterium]